MTVGEFGSGRCGVKPGSNSQVTGFRARAPGAVAGERPVVVGDSAVLRSQVKRGSNRLPPCDVGGPKHGCKH